MATFADLLTGPAARHALAHRDIAAVFRILRDAGVSQYSIAHATGQMQSEVSEIISSGRQVQSVAVLERIADGLGVPRGWMGLAYSPDRAPTTEREAQTEGCSDANRLRHAVTGLLGSPVFGPAEPIRVRCRPTPVPGRIGPADVEQVAATTEQLSQLKGELGGIPVTSALTAHAQASEALLGATMSEPVQQRLLIALADLHRTAGAAASSAGLLERACEHFTRGMDCAGTGGDLSRAVVSLSYLGGLELPAAPNEALKLFQLGAAVAPSGLVRAVVEYDCAYALALLGVVPDALAALHRAHDTYQVVRDEPPPWTYFATSLTHIEGRAYLALRRFDRAVLAFSAAVDGANHAVACTVSNSGLLATAQLRSGELGSGLQTAQRVIKLAKNLRSVSMRDGLKPLQEAAAARRDSACQDLAREVATLRRAA